MRSSLVVMLAVLLYQTFASIRLVKISLFSSSSPKRPMKDSAYAFSHGLPGSMYSVSTPDAFSHLLSALAMNSGPLSERM